MGQCSSPRLDWPFDFSFSFSARGEKTLRSRRIRISIAIALQKRTSTSFRLGSRWGAISRDTGLGIFFCYAPTDRHSTRLVETFSRHAPLVYWKLYKQTTKGRFLIVTLFQKCTAHYVHLPPLHGSDLLLLFHS